MKTINVDNKQYVVEGTDESYCIHGVVADGEATCSECEWLISLGEAPEPEEE